MTFVLKSDILIIISSQDQAGMNMLEFFKNKSIFDKNKLINPQEWPVGEYTVFSSGQIKLLVIPQDQIFTDYLADKIECDLVIYASKHSSEAGQKSLLVHTTGNWNKEAGYGGKDYELAFAPADVLGFVYRAIRKLQNRRKMEEYWTGFECTHHGPTSLEPPVIYVETGGTEKEWNDLDACKLIVDVIWTTSNSFLERSIPHLPTFIGLGGNHYCSSFVKKMDNNDFNFGHIAPKYTHKKLPDHMIEQAYHRTLAEEKFFLIDKKGARSKDRKRFVSVIENNGWDWEYT